MLKGQLDKAIKDYQQVVAMEPNEVRYRQRLAELLVRDHRKEEAIAQYEDIGKHYAENSYFLKAIAIYKQIQRLSPGDSAVSLTIASLNHQQGLIGNALAEYGQVVAQLEKDGALKEALKVVEKMLGVDAGHVATRLRQAELLFSTGAADHSRQAFTALLSSLQARGHAGEAEAVSARMRQLFPGQPTSGAATEKPADDLLAPDGSGPADEIPGVAEHLLAPWETEEPPPAESVAVAAQGDVEPPDAFSLPLAAGEEPAAAAPGPSPFEPPVEPEAAQPAATAAAPVSAWEEEIELDLDDEFPPGLAAPPAPLAAAPAAPQPVVYHSPAPETGNEADTGVDLHLDFSLDLDFDEVVDSLDEEPQDTEPQTAVELDSEEESSQGPGLSQDLPVGFADIPWSEEQEPSEPQGFEEPEELEEHSEALEPEERPEGVELEIPAEFEMPEELTAPLGSAEPEAALPWGGEEGEEEAKRGWEEIYPGCDELPESELDTEELESHYDLGIGYKEMGMYAGAIKEFDIAARNPQRRVGCLTLQAICYREKGEPEQAEDLLRRGLSLDVLSDDDRICLDYELAVLLEANGGVEEAITLYREVVRANPGYHDVSRRLSALSGEEHLDIIDLELEEG